MPTDLSYLTADDLKPLLDRISALESAVAALSPPAPAPHPQPPPPAPPPPPPLGFVSLAWNAPAEGLRVAGNVTARLAGRAFKNVEIFVGDAMVARCAITGGGTVATAVIDTTKFPNGSLALTARGWDAPAGQPANSDAIAGPRNIIVANPMAAAAAASARPPGYKLVKDWDFGTAAKIKTLARLAVEFAPFYVYNGGTLDTLAGNGEWQRYQDFNVVNHMLTNDSLMLTATLGDRGLTKGAIYSGMIRSLWTTKYGYFEARMKGPPGVAMWPAFWLNPQDQKWPPEIDIVELVSNAPGRDWRTNTHHSVVAGAQGATLHAGSKLNEWNMYFPGRGFDWATQFHVYAALWTPGLVRMFVDNVEVAAWYYAWLHDDGSDGGPAHVLVNLAVGGSWPGDPVAASDFPAALEVDYVRVWQTP